MPFLSKVFKNKDAASTRSKLGVHSEPAPPPKPKWEEAWNRTTVQPEDVVELLHVCTEELKSRGIHPPGAALRSR